MKRSKVEETEQQQQHTDQESVFSILFLLPELLEMIFNLFMPKKDYTLKDLCTFHNLRKTCKLFHKITHEIGVREKYHFFQAFTFSRWGESKEVELDDVDLDHHITEKDEKKLSLSLEYDNLWGDAIVHSLLNPILAISSRYEKCKTKCITSWEYKMGGFVKNDTIRFVPIPLRGVNDMIAYRRGCGMIKISSYFHSKKRNKKNLIRATDGIKSIIEVQFYDKYIVKKKMKNIVIYVAVVEMEGQPTEDDVYLMYMTEDQLNEKTQ